ncbi:MAG: hypothetical protein GVY13_17415 [Alphaproteobacteria bacterium]|jgi:uncharacterized protein YjbI with pentapeptide repeats|nr:hypothetical protein [Alphaproteobacteria bacterium]
MGTLRELRCFFLAFTALFVAALAILPTDATSASEQPFQEPEIRGSNVICEHPLPHHIEWSDQEKWVWSERICVGQAADLSEFEDYQEECSTNVSEFYSDNRVISNQFLNFILRTDPYRSIASRYGVHLACAIFEDSLNLSNLAFDNQIRIYQTLFLKDIFLDDIELESDFALSRSNVLGEFSLENASLSRLALVDSRVQGLLDSSASEFSSVYLANINLIGGFESQSTTIVDWMTISDAKLRSINIDFSSIGSANIHDVRFSGAFFGREMRIAGSLILSNLQRLQEVRMNDSVFGGSLRLNNIDTKYSIDVSGISSREIVIQDILCNGSMIMPFTSSEEVGLINMSVFEDINLFDSMINGSLFLYNISGLGDSSEINMSYSDIAQNVFLYNVEITKRFDARNLTVGGVMNFEINFEAEALLLMDSFFGRGLDVRDTIVDRINMSGTDVSGFVGVSDTFVRGTINFIGLSVSNGLFMDRVWSAEIHLANSSLGNRLELQEIKSSVIMAAYSIVGSATVQNSAIGYISANGSNIDGSFILLLSSLYELRVDSAQIRGSFNVRGESSIGNLDLGGTEIRGSFVIDGDTTLKNLTLMGSYIGGRIDVDGITVRHNFDAREIVVRGVFESQHAFIGRNALLSQSLIDGGINMNGMTVIGDLDLGELRTGQLCIIEEALIMGGLNLENSAIGGRLSMYNSAIAGTNTSRRLSWMDSIDEYVSIVVAGADINGDLDLRATKMAGSILGANLAVEGHLDVSRAIMVGANFLNSNVLHDFVAINASISGQIVLEDLSASNVFLRGGSDLNDINLHSAEIRGSLDLSGSRISGHIDMTASRIGDELRFVQIDRISGQKMLPLPSWERGSRLTLRETSARFLTTTPDGWSGLRNRVEMRDFYYDNLSLDGRQFGYLDEFDDIINLEYFLSFQEGYDEHHFPNVFHALAQTLENSGQATLSDKVMILANDHERSRPTTPWLRKLALVGHDWLLGYGYETSRVFLAFVVWVLIGSIWLPCRFSPCRQGKIWDRVKCKFKIWIKRVFYSLDTAVPLIELNRNTKNVRLSSSYPICLHIYSFIGFILISLAIAAITGLIDP